MSVLSRFRTGCDKHYVKARIYERGSLKGDCVCCGRRSFGVLIRLIEPKKCDRVLCTECVVRLAIGEQIKIEGRECLFGVHAINPRRGKKPGPKAKPGPKPGKKKRVVPLCKKCGQRHWQMQPCPDIQVGIDLAADQPDVSVPTPALGYEMQDDSSLTSENPSIEEAEDLQPVIDAD
jgi:hypothetical protein